MKTQHKFSRSSIANKSTLIGQVALVTGATRGIGLAMARALAREGCGLILTGRNQLDLSRASKELAKLQANRKKIRILDHLCDIRDPHSVDGLFRVIRREFSGLDILINNAGIAHAHLPIEKLPFPIWREVLATNLDGTFLVTQAALAIMRRGAIIVNNLSVAANRVFPGSAAYNTSKHGALGFTNTLREELRPRGIRVVGLLAGATDTEIWQTLWPEAPRRKMMSPETVAQAVLDAILLPGDATLEHIEIRPQAGTL